MCVGVDGTGGCGWMHVDVWGQREVRSVCSMGLDVGLGTWGVSDRVRLAACLVVAACLAGSCAGLALSLAEPTLFNFF